MPGLFGEEFDIDIQKPKAKELLNKINKPKKAQISAEKVLASKVTSIPERLATIKENVLRILGKQKDRVVVLDTKDKFEKYVSGAIQAGIIAIDTETNNSVDAVTCQLMGLCLYYPGAKQAYIPANHVSLDNIRLPWQLNETTDIAEQLRRINESGIKQIFHNAKFDYEVLKCTCGVAMKPHWDTFIGARLLNENERAGLKQQYIQKIDPKQAKYDIESLFEHIPYKFVDPQLFAMYAATDSYMTYKLYEWQLNELEKPEYGPHMDMTGTHEVKGLRWVFHNVEMPITIVAAEMELRGVCIDEELGKRLKTKYNKMLADIDNQIEAQIQTIDPIIRAWQISDAANAQSKTYVSKKSKMTEEKILQQYQFEDEKGRYKLSKPKSLILEYDPEKGKTINLASPAQLMILFFDILEVGKAVDDFGKTLEPETGKDALKAIKERFSSYLPKLEELYVDEEDLDQDATAAVQRSNDDKEVIKYGTAAKLADLLLQRRSIAKLVTTYIDVIPDLATHWPDHRIRFHLNTLGTDTGRFSSGGKWKFLDSNDKAVEISGINSQNIPSRGDGSVCRMLFKASENYHKAEITDNYYTVPETDEVETTAGWKFAKDLAVGDVIVGEDNQDTIRNIIQADNKYLLYV